MAPVRWKKNEEKIISKKMTGFVASRVAAMVDCNGRTAMVEHSGRVKHERRRLRVASSRRYSARKMMGIVAAPFEGWRASSRRCFVRMMKGFVASLFRLKDDRMMKGFVASLFRLKDDGMMKGFVASLLRSKDDGRLRDEGRWREMREMRERCWEGEKEVGREAERTK